MEPRVTLVLHIQFSLFIFVTSGVNGHFQNDAFPNSTNTTQSLSPTPNTGNMPTNTPTAVQVSIRENITNSTSPTSKLIPSATTLSHPGTSKSSSSSSSPSSSTTVRSGNSNSTNSTENTKEQEQSRKKMVLITILMLIIVVMLLVLLVHRLMKDRRSSRGGSAYDIIVIRETVMRWLGFPLCKGAGGGEEEEEEIEGGQVEDDGVESRDAEASAAAVKEAEDSDSSDTSEEGFSPGEDTDRLAGEQPEEERPGSEASEQVAETKAVRKEGEGEGSTPALCAQENNGVEADWCDVTVL